jgi:hypothetical protein
MNFNTINMLPKMRAPQLLLAGAAAQGRGASLPRAASWAFRAVWLLETNVALRV